MSKRRPRVQVRTRAPLTARAATFVRSLPDHSLIDRLVRGRAWIPVLGIMLAGIVAMQVEVLKLGATMGRAIERSSALQSRNELLRQSVAQLSDQQRIERLAAGLGMVMPAPGGVGFINARGGNLAKAAANVKAPDATTFLASLAASEAALSSATTPPPSTSASSSTATQTSTTTGTSTTLGVAATSGSGTTSTTAQTGATSTGGGTTGTVAPAGTSQTTSSSGATAQVASGGGAPLAGG